MITAANIKDFSTADLVAEYNMLTGNSIKKFQDRATAERRLLEVVNGENDDTFDVSHDKATPRTDRPHNMPEVYGFETHGQTHCPHCGVHLSNGVGIDKDEVNGKIIRNDTHEFTCLGCGGEFGPEIKKAAASATRSESIHKSWQDKEIAKKRAVRHQVHVKFGGNLNSFVFKSVAEAFRKLHLPMGQHIKFRGNLFFSKTATIGDYTFTIVE